MNEAAKRIQSDLEDALLECMTMEPTHQSWAIVSIRPDIFDFAAPASMTPNTRLIASDDCGAIIHDGAYPLATIGISTMTDGDTPRYLLTFDLLTTERTGLMMLSMFKGMAALYKPVTFQDSHVLEHINATNPTRTAAIYAYLKHPRRTLPIFIRRNSAGKDRKSPAIIRHQQLGALGPIIANTEIWSEFRDRETHSLSTLAIMPDMSVHTFDPRYSDGFDDDLAIFFDDKPAFTFGDENENETGTPISKPAINLWCSTIFKFEQFGLPQIRHWGDEERVEYARIIDVMAEERGYLVTPAPIGAEDPTPTAPELSPIDHHGPAVTAKQADHRQNDRTPPPSEVTSAEPPTDSRYVTEWAQHHFTDSIVILPRAERAMAKSKHPNPGRVARSLALLAREKYACYSGQAREEAVSAFERGLQELRLRDTFSNAERLSGRTGDAYIVQYDGRKLLLDRHLASQSSAFNHPTLLRIYYTYDRPTRKIVVGYLPDHLPCSIQ